MKAELVLEFGKGGLDGKYRIVHCENHYRIERSGEDQMGVPQWNLIEGNNVSSLVLEDRSDEHYPRWVSQLLNHIRKGE